MSCLTSPLKKRYLFCILFIYLNTRIYFLQVLENNKRFVVCALYAVLLDLICLCVCANKFVPWLLSVCALKNRRSSWDDQPAFRVRSAPVTIVNSFVVKVSQQKRIGRVVEAFANASCLRVGGDSVPSTTVLSNERWLIHPLPWLTNQYRNRG